MKDFTMPKTAPQVSSRAPSAPIDMRSKHDEIIVTQLNYGEPRPIKSLSQEMDKLRLTLDAAIKSRVDFTDAESVEQNADLIAAHSQFAKVNAMHTEHNESEHGLKVKRVSHEQASVFNSNIVVSRIVGGIANAKTKEGAHIEIVSVKTDKDGADVWFKDYQEPSEKNYMTPAVEAL